MNYTARELSLLSTTDVLGYILAQNAARNAQAVAEGWEFWTTMPVRLDFVAEFKNAYELEHRYACGTYSDVFKDAYFHRPHIDMSGWTLSEIEAKIEEICESERHAEELETEWEAELDRMEREEVALGMKRPASDMKLEEWEIYEAKAEAAGY
jgi:hypothetical protein